MGAGIPTVSVESNRCEAEEAARLQAADAAAERKNRKNMLHQSDADRPKGNATTIRRKKKTTKRKGQKRMKHIHINRCAQLQTVK